MPALILTLATLLVVSLVYREAREAVDNLLWIQHKVREDQLDRDFAWWARARRSPVMAERMVARQVLHDLFDYHVEE